MKYVFSRSHNTFIRNIIYLLFGVFIGFFFCIYLHGNQIDDLIEKNEKLKLELKNYQDEIDTLKKEEEQREQNKLIRTIKFHVNEEIEAFSETDLLEVLLEETHFLIGKRIDDVKKNPDYIYQLLDQEVYSIDEKQFKVNVRFIYIDSTTEIWIYVKEYK